MIYKTFIFLVVFQTTNIKSKLGDSYTLNERRSNQGASTEERNDENQEAPTKERNDENQEATIEERNDDNVERGLPSFSWCGPSCMMVQFPDGTSDRITLSNVYPGDESSPCVFDGTFHKDSSASVTVSGCHYDANVFITVYSNHLKNRNMFNIKEGIIEEPTDPYEIGDDYDYLEDVASSNRDKRETQIDSDYADNEYKDYIEEEYDEFEYDGSVDFTPPPVLILNIRLSFEETMKAKLGSELASQRYIKSVIAHTRTHLQHSTLGSRIELNLLGSIEFIPNRHFKPTFPHMEEAKLVKKNEPSPTVFFCHTDDTNANTGIAFTRKGCDAQKAVAIVKHRKDVNMAAITMSHEIGHLLGQKHDSKEDKPKASIDACSGTGIMSSGIEPGKRPAKWSFCSAYRFSRWYNSTGHACLREPDVWGKWSSWSSCSQTCGGGNQTRTRSCTSQGNCRGSATESRTCSTDSCVRSKAPTVLSKGLRYFKATMGSESEAGTDDDVSLKLSGGVNGQTCKTGVLWEGYWYDSWSYGDVEEYKDTNQDFGDCGDFEVDGSPIGFTIVKTGNDGLKLVNMEFDIGGETYVWSGAAWWDPTHPVLLANSSLTEFGRICDVDCLSKVWTRGNDSCCTVSAGQTRQPEVYVCQTFDGGCFGIGK